MSEAVPYSRACVARNAWAWLSRRVERFPRAKDTVLLGGGGHAAVLIDALQSAGHPIPGVCLDDNAAKWGQEVAGVPIRGGLSQLSQLWNDGFRKFVLGIGSAGSTSVRQSVFAKAIDCGLEPVSVCHPLAWRSSQSHVGFGVQRLPGSIVHTAATLGDNVIVNSGAIVEHDCIVDSHCHLATGARLAGRVMVGEGTHIGIGAVVLQGVTIGSGCVVGAGAVVLDNLPARVVAVGVPARVLRSMAA